MQHLVWFHHRIFYSRARSTKTRIETFDLYTISMQNYIREQDPLKQGLKPNFSSLNPLGSVIREQDPLKQGLKLVACPCPSRTVLFASKIH